MGSVPSAPELVVGNDVVDLSDPRWAHKEGDERFLARVFTPSERRAIEAAPDPARALWAHWAAKEAAFKVVSKRRAPRPPSGTAPSRWR